MMPVEEARQLFTWGVMLSFFAGMIVGGLCWQFVRGK